MHRTREVTDEAGEMPEFWTSTTCRDGGFRATQMASSSAATHHVHAPPGWRAGSGMTGDSVGELSVTNCGLEAKDWRGEPICFVRHCSGVEGYEIGTAAERRTIGQPRQAEWRIRFFCGRDCT